MQPYEVIGRADFNQQTLLLADDCEDDLVIMRAALDRAGLLNPLQIVKDGEAVIAYLSGTGKYADRNTYPMPVTVFLDLNMPKIGGLEVLSWIRGQEQLKLMPVHILSASTRVADVTKAAEIGAQTYIVKPSKYSELIEMLRAWRDFAQFQSVLKPIASPSQS